MSSVPVSRAPMAMRSPLAANPKSSHAPGAASAFVTKRHRAGRGGATVGGAGVVEGSVVGLGVGLVASAVALGASVAAARLCCGAKVDGAMSEQAATTTAGRGTQEIH